jgi:hypothetical protein
MSSINSKLYAFYIPLDFEDVWEKFLKIAIPKERTLYLEDLKIKKANKDLNRYHDYKKNKFVSSAIRRLIARYVEQMEKKITSEVQINATSQITN